MLGNDFMLRNSTGKELYERIAKNAPIYDFHCHLSAKEIYENKRFSNISKIFLEFDHYKWRAMRYSGIAENYITGDSEDFDKFKMWARTCERLIGSPLYHWTNMELKKYFNINEFLCERNAEEIYNKCNEKIELENLTPVKFIKDSNVKLICTTDDPIDDLEYHKLLAKKSDIEFKVLPTFRPDKAINISNENYKDYIEALKAKAEIEINNYSDLIEALKRRIRYFNEGGCKLSDHSIESLSYYETDEDEIEKIFKKRLNNEFLSLEEIERFKVHTIKLLAKEYKEIKWVMQLHIGAMRNNNDIMYKKLGPDSGFDIMNDFNIAADLSKLLNAINNNLSLPKTIIYALNSKDNNIISTLPHCFTEDGVCGKLQFGAAWWHNDNKEGIYEHLKMISNQGMLAYFVGMLTDSRSFLSYTRHDYFRRILCSFIGELVESGEFNNNSELLNEIVEGVCFRNIKEYLELKV